MIRGKPKEILLPPVVNKNIDEAECFVPYNIDLRNGVYTDAKYWKKRNGYAVAATLSDEITYELQWGSCDGTGME
jgi:hypothetical protein